MEKEKRAPRNTAQDVQENPILGLVPAIGEGGSGIIAQEAQGQRSFVGSDTLPTDMRRHSGYNTMEILEAAGVKFLGVVEGDKMFQCVELPQGWKKMATDHFLWSNLVDDKGRVRAAIFYKAAFYDRSAHISLSCRFGVSFDYDGFDKENVGVANVTDGDRVIHTTEQISTAEGETRHDVSEKARKLAVEWLDKNHPDWRNPGAYWELHNSM
jgi:hypothetical protein